jgi:hypothetical protein
MSKSEEPIVESDVENDEPDKNDLIQELRKCKEEKKKTAIGT